MKNITNPKIRKSNFELMRIISMLFVVMWHIILHGQLFNAGGTTKFFLEFLILLGAVHINSYVLVSGYFQCDKNFSIKKFLNLFLTIWFYKTVIIVIYYLHPVNPIPKLELLKGILPLDFGIYWYMNCYLLLYLLTPWLNKLIKHMNQKEYRKLLITLFILFSIIPYITKQIVVANNGYTIVQFVFMYLIGAYLKKYPIRNNTHFKNYSRNKCQVIFFAGFWLFTVLNFVNFQFSHYLFMFSNPLLRTIGTFLETSFRAYSNPIIIIQSVLYFLYFSTLRLRSKRINFISLFTLDVYLIHENLYIVEYLKKIFVFEKWLQYNGYKIIIFTLLSTVLVYICCIILGIIKKRLFTIISKNKYFNIIKEKIFIYTYNI